MTTVKPEYLQLIQALKRDADHLAFCIGVAWIEFRAKEAALFRETKGQVGKINYLSLGALYFEYTTLVQGFEAKVKANQVRQRSVGEHALKDLGLDHAEHEYTILPDTGEVRELVQGEWIALALKEPS